ncbi:MAG: DUF4124 domain-containing protein [Pseudomonas sp.]
MSPTYLRLTLGVLITLMSASAAAQIYKWKDAEGNTIFSDQPHPGSQTIELPPTNTVETPRPNRPAPSGGFNSTEDDQAQLGEPGSYRVLKIASPEDGEAIRSNEGSVNLTINTEPALSSGHLLRAEIDGELRQEAVPGNNQPVQRMTLHNIDRGSHSIRVLIFNSRGEQIQGSSAITVHLQRTSVNQPGRTGNNQAPRPGGGQSGG